GDAFFDGVESPQQQSWFSRIATEHDNLRAALSWSTGSSPIEGLRLANSLSAHWRIHGHLTEGREWLARLLDVFPVDGPTRDRARGLRVVAMLAMTQGDHAAAMRRLQESLALYREIDDPQGKARVLSTLSYVSLCQGLYPEAEALGR